MQVPEDAVDRMWRINVKPIYHSAKIIVPYWREKQRKGVVINLSSISAPRPRPNLVWYAASKGAVTAVCIPGIVRLGMRIGVDHRTGNERSGCRTHQRWNSIQLYPARRRCNGNAVSPLLPFTESPTPNSTPEHKSKAATTPSKAVRFSAQAYRQAGSPCRRISPTRRVFWRVMRRSF